MSVTDAPTDGRHVGQSMKRREDPRMITGRGNYIDDMVLPGMLHMAVVRSPEAHATITSIDAEEAKASRRRGRLHPRGPGRRDPRRRCPCAWDPPGVEIKVPEHWPIKKGEVKHVGDPIAVVVAETKGQAMDGADLVIAELDPKPAVVDPERALEDGSPAGVGGVRHQRDPPVVGVGR